MPLVRIDAVAGRRQEQVKCLLDAVHRALLMAFQVPLRDRYQVYHEQPITWIVADILRIKDGILVEHWDVFQDEATREQSRSGRPMFGDTFPERLILPATTVDA